MISGARGILREGTGLEGWHVRSGREGAGSDAFRAKGRGRLRLPAALLGLVLAASVLSGCGSFWGKKEVVENNDPPDVIYGKAEVLINKGAYGDAAKEYEEVDINHPYSQEARRAIVMAAYAYYKAGKFDDAVSAADRYLTLHPGTQESDLAQNIIGMSYYDQVLDPEARPDLSPASRSRPTRPCCSAIPTRAMRPRLPTGRASCATCSPRAR